MARLGFKIPIDSICLSLDLIGYSGKVDYFKANRTALEGYATRIENTRIGHAAQQIQVAGNRDVILDDGLRVGLAFNHEGVERKQLGGNQFFVATFFHNVKR